MAGYFPTGFVGYPTDEMTPSAFNSDGRASWEGPMAQGRKRIKKHEATFEERLEEEAIRFKEAAKSNRPAALPENCYCGEQGRQRQLRA